MGETSFTKCKLTVLVFTVISSGLNLCSAMFFSVYTFTTILNKNMRLPVNQLSTNVI